MYERSRSKRARGASTAAADEAYGVLTGDDDRQPRRRFAETIR